VALFPTQRQFLMEQRPAPSRLGGGAGSRRRRPFLNPEQDTASHGWREAEQIPARGQQCSSVHPPAAPPPLPPTATLPSPSSLFPTPPEVDPGLDAGADLDLEGAGRGSSEQRIWGRVPGGGSPRAVSSIPS
jgi:hypothetical protein